MIEEFRKKIEEFGVKNSMVKLFKFLRVWLSTEDAISWIDWPIERSLKEDDDEFLSRVVQFSEPKSVELLLYLYSIIYQEIQNKDKFREAFPEVYVDYLIVDISGTKFSWK